MLGLAADAEGRVYAIDSVREVRVARRSGAGDRGLGRRARRARPFRLPTGAHSTRPAAYYLSDSGDWGAVDGLRLAHPAGGEPEVWTEEPELPQRSRARRADGSTL